MLVALVVCFSRRLRKIIRMLQNKWLWQLTNRCFDHKNGVNAVNLSSSKTESYEPLWASTLISRLELSPGHFTDWISGAFLSEEVLLKHEALDLLKASAIKHH